MQGESDSKASDRFKARCNSLAGRMANCSSVTQSIPNEKHTASNRHVRLINGRHTENRYFVLDPEETSIDDDSDTRGPVRFLSGNRSGRGV
jgi:hypothetical protein